MFTDEELAEAEAIGELAKLQNPKPLSLLELADYLVEIREAEKDG